jgi:methyl-accepting chemotaxis protein
MELWIFSCQSCGKQYRIDESKITGDRARLKCSQCGGIMIVSKTEPASPAAPTAPPTEPAPPAEEAAQRPEGTPAPSPAKKEKVSFGLLPRIVVVMLMVSLVPLGIYFYASFDQTSYLIRSGTETNMNATAEALAGHVDEWIDKNTRMLQMAAGLDAIVSMDRIRQEAVLKSIQKEYPWIYLAFTVDPDGINVARSDGNPLKDYSDRQYYKDVAGGKKVAWQTLIGKTSKKPALVLAVPVFGASGELRGALAAAMTTDTISRSVATWKKGSTGFAFLVDETDKVIAHQVKEFVLTERDLSDDALIAAYRGGRKSGIIEFVNRNGQPAIGYVKTNTYGWALAIEQEKEEVYASLSDIRRFVWILLGGTVLLVGLIAWMSAKAIVSPIVHLTEAADRMSLGDLNVEIDIKSKDEIGLLAKALGRMQTSLNLAMSRLRKKRR